MDPEQLQSLIDPKTMNKKQGKWLRLHERLNHTPRLKMRILCDKEILPKSLDKWHSLPLCPSCAFGNSKRRKWRTKPRPGTIEKVHQTAPGILVCVDQLISSQPGLVPQSSGCLTASRVWAYNIFFDVHSEYGHSFMMNNATLDQRLQEKYSFVRDIFKYGVKVKAHMAGNGCFAKLGLHNEVYRCNKTISFRGVEDHRQNRIVERHIGKISVRDRTVLLHAKRFWPEGIAHMFWPFAISEAMHLVNTLTLDASGQTHLPSLTATEAHISLRDQKIWVHPVHVLESKIQTSSNVLLK